MLPGTMPHTRRRRIWKRALLVAGLLVAAAAAFFVYQIGPRTIIGMLRYDQRRDGHLRPGDAAPDVALVDLDGRTTARLHQRCNGRPLVLVFGSFT
jgi:hypothetical protein